MAIFASKVLRTGWLVLIGIGGVISTSSLVFGSVEEKFEEKIKTKSLSGKGPSIKEYKDQDESEQKQEEKQQSDQPSNLESSSEKSQDEASERRQSQSPESKEEKTLEGNLRSSEEIKDGQGKGVDSMPVEQGLSNEVSEMIKAEESIQGHVVLESSTTESEDNSDSQSNGSTIEGSNTVEHDNISGTIYGTRDVRMTEKEIETAKNTSNNLEDLHSKLKGLHYIYWPR